MKNVHFGKKNIISKLKRQAFTDTVKCVIPVLRKVLMKDADDDNRDLQYWLSQPVQKRAEATTFLISQMLRKGERMDKSMVNKIRPAKRL